MERVRDHTFAFDCIVSIVLPGIVLIITTVLLGGVKPKLSVGGCLLLFLWVAAEMALWVKCWIPLLRQATNKIVFESNGIHVKQSKKADIFLAWDDIQEVGLRLCGTAAMGTYIRSTQQIYLYYAAKQLCDEERMKIGTYRQYQISAQQVVFLNCNGIFEESDPSYFSLDRQLLTHLPHWFVPTDKPERISEATPCIWWSPTNSHIYCQQQVSTILGKYRYLHSMFLASGLYGMLVGSVILIVLMW